MSKAICKTCGGTPPNHVPSVFDKDGIGHPGHRTPTPEPLQLTLTELVMLVKAKYGLGYERASDVVYKAVEPIFTSKLETATQDALEKHQCGNKPSGKQVDTLSPELDRKYAEWWIGANHRTLKIDAFKVLSEMANDGLISRAALRKAHEKAVPAIEQSKIMLGRVDDPVSDLVEQSRVDTTDTANPPPLLHKADQDGLEERSGEK